MILLVLNNWIQTPCQKFICNQGKHRCLKMFTEICLKMFEEVIEMKLGPCSACFVKAQS